MCQGGEYRENAKPKNWSKRCCHTGICHHFASVSYSCFWHYRFWSAALQQAGHHKCQSRGSKVRDCQVDNINRRCCGELLPTPPVPGRYNALRCHCLRQKRHIPERSHGNRNLCASLHVRRNHWAQPNDNHYREDGDENGTGSPDKLLSGLRPGDDRAEIISTMLRIWSLWSISVS